MNPVTASAPAEEGLHPDVVHGMIVGGVGTHAAPADRRWAAARRPVRTLRRGGAGRGLRPCHRAAVFLIMRGQHGAGEGGGGGQGGGKGEIIKLDMFLLFTFRGTGLVPLGWLKDVM